jgi:hypothetical protein
MPSHFDRRIHGVSQTGGEIVRYERAGKWYVEYPEGNRLPCTVEDAALFATADRATFRLGVAGGQRFDALVRRLVDG